jgi:hypothetical protein
MNQPDVTISSLLADPLPSLDGRVDGGAESEVEVSLPTEEPLLPGLTACPVLWLSFDEDFFGLAETDWVVLVDPSRPSTLPRTLFPSGSV